MNRAFKLLLISSLKIKLLLSLLIDLKLSKMLIKFMSSKMGVFVKKEISQS